MAGEIQIPYGTTGATLYAIIRNSIGQAYHTSSGFQTYSTANLASYKIALTEQGTASRVYVGDFPSVATGVYGVVIRVQAGGSPAESDVFAGVGNIEWDGTAVVPLSSRLAPTTAGRTLDVSLGGEAGVDWSNIGSPTTTVGLSGTTVKAVTDNVGAVLANSVVHGGTTAQLVLGGTGSLGGLSITQNNDFPAILVQSQSNTYSALRIDNIGAGGCLNLTSSGNLPVVNISQSGSGPAVKIDSDCIGDTAVVEIEHQGTSATGAGAAFRVTGGNAMGMYVSGGAIGLQVTAGTYDIFADIEGDLSGKVLGSGSGTITGTGVRSDVREWNGTAPSNLQSGRVDSYTGAMAADVLTASALATDAVTEIQSGLATAAALTSFASSLPDDTAEALLDLTDGVETSVTVRQALRAIAAVLAGKRTNSGTATETFDAIGNVGTTRVTGNLNSSGDGTPTLNL